MSGPVTTADAAVAEPDTAVAAPPCVEVSDDREAVVGRFRVRRALPRRGRRSVGAWCFADHMGPADVTEDAGLDIGPHPHLGLHTVTWLVDGEALHRDSLGSEQVVRPGELNLMTAGHGVAHSEEATGAYRGRLHGVQLWVAQPEATLHGPPAFEHHDGLPVVEGPQLVATVLVGEFGGAASPARADSPLVAADLSLPGGTATFALRPDFEYAVLVLAGAVTLSGEQVIPGRFAYLGRGRDELTVHAPESARALLLGGTPLDEPLLMWWNFVARTRDEIDAAYDDWQRANERFGRVASALPRLTTAPPPWRRP